MQILITGANGFLGYYLTGQLLDAGHEVIATGKGGCRLPYSSGNFQYVQLDVSDPYEVHDIFERFAPDVVVHAAAMTKPDECEENQWQAYITNVEASVSLLINAETHKSYFLYVSTDFVFDGEKGMYTEDDKPSPVNFYGKTKLEAEEAVMNYEHDWAIARTVLVYGKPVAARENLLTIVKSKLEAGEGYRVFNDQLRTPTYVEDLASGILLMIEKRATGIFHLSGEDLLTPYEMAIAVADHFSMDSSKIEMITRADWQQAALRPPKTGFNISKAKAELGYSPRSFREGLARTFEIEK